MALIVDHDGINWMFPL